MKEKKNNIIIVAIIVVVLGGLTIYSNQRNVIPDQNLANVINSRLEREQGTVITKADMAIFNSLTCRNCEIESLEGMQYAVNITNVDMENNYIKDASQLKNLKNLKTLNLKGNEVNKEEVCTEQYEVCEA